MKQEYKTKALEHVRSVCDDLKYVNPRPTVHLEHWLRGVCKKWRLDLCEVIAQHSKAEADFSLLFRHYNLTKDGENQSPEFYKSYCDICSL